MILLDAARRASLGGQDHGDSLQQEARSFLAARLILVRHGETVGESSIRYHGRSDVKLSALGCSQMRAAAQFLAREKFARVFSSPLKRAVQSARLIAGENAEIATVADFAEIDFGLFEGLTVEEIRARYPEHFASWNERRFEQTYAYPRGESRADFSARVRRGLEWMLELWRAIGTDGTLQGTALLAAHRGVIREVSRGLAGVEPRSDLGSIHILVHQEDWRAAELDIVDHLQELAG
jgi:broad specificity phosphatase PhoE